MKVLVLKNIGELVVKGDGGGGGLPMPDLNKSSLP